VTQLEGRLGDALRECREGEALLRVVDDRVVLARVLCLRAELEHALGDPTAAAACLGEAERLAEAFGAVPGSAFCQALDAARAAIGG
jgi:hypothetical protein